jgi:non-heme chloroperoxidase
MPVLTTSEGVAIHYLERGTGTPLVFLHGWAMSGDVWLGQMDVAKHHRCIAPDFRGHGRSAAPDSGYTFDCLSRDLAELFSRLDLDRAIVVAWSMGVLVALQAFPFIRSRLTALVFVSGTSRFTAGDDYPFGLAPSASRVLGVRLKKRPEQTVRDFAAGMFTEEERARGGMTAATDVSRLPAPYAARESLVSLATADLRPVLPGIDLPVLLVHGSADAICPVTAASFMVQMLPNASLVVMEGAGHAPFLSRPGEFTGILSSFVDGIYAKD